MILFALQCAQKHRFEAWFRDGKTYERQARKRVIACPTCASTEVSKAPMAPRVRKSSHDSTRKTAVAMMNKAMTDMRKMVEDNCDYVGEAFPEEARKIHYGETEERGIYGEATEEDAKSLVDEGVPVGRLPWPPRRDS